MIGDRQHLEALRDADLRFATERDRRYAEVAEARAEALKIKEEADRTALGLAREIQVYKDEKANELRSQIERERGLMATKDDLSAAVEKIQAERRTGSLDARTLLFSILLVLAGLAAAVSPHL